MGNRFLALRGVGPEVEVRFLACLDAARWGFESQVPCLRGLGRAPNQKMAGPAGWWAGNTSLRGGHRGKP